MVDDDRILLPLAVKASICLLIQFKAPCKAEPYERGTAGLEIQPVTCGSRMDDCRRNPSRIPVIDILRGLYLPYGETRLYPLRVMLIPVSDQYGLAVRAFDKVFQGVEFAVMDVMAVFILAS